MGDGTLFVVATPIGNLEDVTLRALRVLGEVDRVYAEDTRRTRVLLERHGIAARPRSLHAHSEASRTREVLSALAAGETVALVSDAGTPLVSDPGERLVAAAARAGHRIEVIPGPSAALAALAGAGLPTDAFTFLGFLPRRKGERARRLAELAPRPETLVLFEAARRLPGTLRELADALGEGRRACVARELTKRHETWERGTLGELASRFAEPPRGEVTLVVEGAPRAPAAPEDLDARIRSALARGESPRAIAAELAASHGAARREVYARALALRDGA